MDARQPGILAIWNDVAPGREAEFDAWFQGEHLAERLAVPGFLYGRRHEAISGTSRYCNFYVTEGPEVLTSSAYRARLDDPTPMTRTIMAQVFRNMCRTVCRRIARRGLFRGAYAVTVRFDMPPDERALLPRLDTRAADASAPAAELWIAADSGPPAEEERLRGGDRKIGGCLMIDTLRQGSAETLGARMQQDFPAADVGVFRVLCQIGQGMGV
jgi:hypothetical protein